jgi:hypothetical protein
MSRRLRTNRPIQEWRTRQLPACAMALRERITSVLNRPFTVPVRRPGCLRLHLKFVIAKLEQHRYAPSSERGQATSLTSHQIFD